MNAQQEVPQEDVSQAVMKKREDGHKQLPLPMSSHHTDPIGPLVFSWSNLYTLFEGTRHVFLFVQLNTLYVV